MKSCILSKVITLANLGIFLIAFQINLASYAQPVQRKAQLPQEAQLTSTQLKLLRTLGIKIAAPTYVPAGFQLEKVQAEVEQHTRGGGIGYILFYRRYDADANEDYCFAIEAINGGIGDLPEGERRYPVNSPVFGKTTLEYGQYGQSSTSTLLSNWLGEENGPFYRFAGTGVSPDLFNCRNVNVQEAVRVTESLRYVKP